MITGGLMKSVLTSLERRYDLTSLESGAIITLNNAGAFLFFPAIIVLGRTIRRLRLFCVCMFFMSAASFAFAVPHFIGGHYVHKTHIKPVCYKGENVSYTGLCQLHDDEWHPLVNKGILWLASFVMGIGTTPMYYLCVLFIEENLNMSDSAFLIGKFKMKNARLILEIRNV